MPDEGFDGGGRLPVIPPPGVQHPLAPRLQERGREYTRRSSADATRTQYASARKLFGEWCRHHGRSPLPADWETVRAYISDLSDDGMAWSTIRQRMSAISQAHEALIADVDEARKKDESIPEVENPCEHHKVRQAAKGIRRTLRARGVVKKKPILAADLARVVDSIKGDDLVSVRDRAILLLGFAGGFRRSEVAGLEARDLEWGDKGLIVTLRFSKTNQTGEPEHKGIPLSAVRTLGAVRAWVASAKVEVGPVFLSFWVDGKVKEPPHAMSGKDVGRMVVRRLVRAGVIPRLSELRAKHLKNPFGAHSLRSGFITEAHDAGQTVKDIMRQTGQKSPATVLGYVQKANVFENNAAEGVAL